MTDKIGSSKEDYDFDATSVAAKDFTDTYQLDSVGNRLVKTRDAEPDGMQTDESDDSTTYDYYDLWGTDGSVCCSAKLSAIRAAVPPPARLIITILLVPCPVLFTIRVTLSTLTIFKPA